MKNPPRNPRTRSLVLGLLVALSGALLAACTTSSGAASSSSSSSSVVAAGPVAAGETSSASSPAAGTGAADRPGSTPGSGRTATATTSTRQIIWTAHLALTLPVTSDGKKADDAAAVTNALAHAREQIEAVAAAPGYVSSSTGGATTWSFTLRVPDSGFTAALTELGSFGTVTNQTSSSQDVSLQVADLAGRIDSANKSIDQFRTLLGKATRISDILSIENELSSREADLESMMRQQASLSDQVALSTITVVVTAKVTPLAAPKAAPVAPGPTGFAKGISAGWHALKQFVKGCLVVLGAVLPFLPVALVLGAAWWFGVHRIRRSRRPAQPVRADD